jgi:hypothetical protein
MKMRNTFFCLAILASACTKFDDAELTQRDSFLQFYSSGNNFNGTVAELDTDGGFIILANIPKEDDNFNSLLIKTDSRGFRTWEKTFENTVLKSIKTTETGYLVLGDSIKINPNSNDPTQFVNTQTLLMQLDASGEVQRFYIQEETEDDGNGNEVEIDFHGNGILTSPGEILILGSRKTRNGNQRTYVTSFNASFAPQWTQYYGLQDRDYVNCNSIFSNASSTLVWASRTLLANQNRTDQYLSVAFVERNSTFENNDLYGENSARNHVPNDIQKSPIGYGVVGTSADDDGSKSNIYFLRVDNNGTIIRGSERYFDGIALNAIDDSSAEPSQTNDTGDAIASVLEGSYVIAGSTMSTVDAGFGGKDILLIKVNQKGEVAWSKRIGGTGDETASSIRMTPDGGLLICGTNTINGLASVMLIKTDANGELK